MRYCEFFPKEARDILAVLKKSGFKAYFVGGCVRDYYMGRRAVDFDITTDADSAKIIKALEKEGMEAVLSGGNCGTVKANCNGIEFEITPHRTEGEYTDHRHPSKVTFVKDIKSDLVRRDFTVNAMALTENDGKEELVDLFCGMEDLEKKLLRCVGDADTRFEEDALRILRAIRFSVQLSFDIEEKTAEAIKQKANLLSFVSGERKAIELRKTFEKGLPQAIFSTFPEVFSEILGNSLGNFAGFKNGSFCEVMFFVLKDKPYDEIQRVLISLSLSSAEKERINAYKNIYDEMRDKTELPMLVIKYGKYLQKYAEIFGNFDVLDYYKNENMPKSIRELEIDGKDLKSIGFLGSDVGRTLEKLFCSVASGEIKNEKAQLYSYAKSLKGI